MPSDHVNTSRNDFMLKYHRMINHFRREKMCVMFGIKGHRELRFTSNPKDGVNLIPMKGLRSIPLMQVISKKIIECPWVNISYLGNNIRLIFDKEFYLMQV